MGRGQVMAEWVVCHWTSDTSPTGLPRDLWNMLQRAHYHHPPEYTVAHTNIGPASIEYRARVLILARAYVGSQPLEFTGYGYSLHRAINDAAYIAMAHILHLHVELATQYPYHPACPLGEKVHLYLSAEREPNHVLCNLVEYVRSSDRYHRVIVLELRQARGRITHLECLIEPYVHMGHIPRIELYEYRGLFKPVESESSRSAQRRRVIAPAPTGGLLQMRRIMSHLYPLHQKMHGPVPQHEWLRMEIPLNHSTMVNASSNGLHRVAKIGPCPSVPEEGTWSNSVCTSTRSSQTSSAWERPWSTASPQPSPQVCSEPWEGQILE
ncbi:hypothetical protein E2562_036056 [Oryza meyeriana var. granulata]|uniref:Uncharacterized protein n=1 Tax=Oryza meyeriana var. granulata TaxID=110450 RepID=A0A6G1FFX3_9ORYZ|nr:hypothetical protein E2562_036056 [Oryza meyeriana var. granulata]